MSEMSERELALQRRRSAYRRTFCDVTGAVHESGRIVLNDLRRVARVRDGGLVISPVSKMVDPHATMYRAGLRDLYERIVGFLDLIDLNQEETPHAERRDTADTYPDPASARSDAG